MALISPVVYLAIALYRHMLSKFELIKDSTRIHFVLKVRRIHLLLPSSN